MAFLRVLFVFVYAGFLIGAAKAEEVITRFDVLIQVSEQGDYTVRETIEVNVEGNKIRRGIFRELPRYYLLDDLQVPFRYDVSGVTRNGNPEPYTRSTEGKAFRIRIGDPDVFLKNGRQQYELTYSVQDEIRRDDNADFVYWNVTGSYWDFPIEYARIRVVMPPNAVLKQTEAFTGRIGSTSSNTSFSQNGNAYIFETTQALQRREGMSIRLHFEKGVIGPVQESTKRFIWWLRNGAMLILSVSFLTMLGFFLRNWNRVGRDPVKPPVFPRYVPPGGYSAAGTSYVHYNRLKGNRPITATLLGLAHKKYIHIDAKDKNRTVIERLKTRNDGAGLNSEETVLLKLLFPRGQGGKITLKKNTPHPKFYSAKTKFERHLAKKFSSKYFRWNGKYIAMGLVLSMAAIIAAFSQKVAGSFPGFGWLVAAVVILNIVFFILLPAPTKYGQKMRAEIEGFKLFMKTAEEGRFDAVKVGEDAPPPMSLDRYEALLPFAIALDVEDPWSKYFEKLMPQEAEYYNPTWSSFSSGGHRSLQNLTDSMVSNIGSGVSSAAPPSSSGSSSSGGFSGGGGGGGGGGGW